MRYFDLVDLIYLNGMSHILYAFKVLHLKKST